MEPGDKILVIDDDATLRLALRAFLEKHGFVVAEAPGGAEGIEAMPWEKPALVLLDLTMPGMNGFEVCHRIKALPEGRSTPVIVMSGLLGTSQKRKALHAGAVDSLQKPLDYEEVEIRIRTHLAIRHQETALKKALHDAGAMNRNLLELNDKLTQSEAVKTRFLALMRNSINNPLTDILGLARSITDQPEGLEKARDLARLIHSNAFRMDCQMRNVFSAAELEAGEARPFITRVNVASVAADVMNSFGACASVKEKTLDLALEGDLQAFPTDGSKLEHILANLVANALDFTGPGGVIRIRLAGEASRLVLSVADEGPGIPEAGQRYLFAPFRAAAGESMAPRGHGLGLPVAKALADLLDGSLHLRSEPGQGCVFTLTLPRAPVLDEVEADALGGDILIFDEPQEF